MERDVWDVMASGSVANADTPTISTVNWTTTGWLHIYLHMAYIADLDTFFMRERSQGVDDHRAAPRMNN